jgi:hypothetical protein
MTYSSPTHIGLTTLPRRASSGLSTRRALTRPFSTCHRVRRGTSHPTGEIEPTTSHGIGGSTAQGGSPGLLFEFGAHLGVHCKPESRVVSHRNVDSMTLSIRRVGQKLNKKHVLFSISLGMPRVRARATIAIRIMGFLTRLKGETAYQTTKLAKIQLINIKARSQINSHLALSS